jgi:hypothetical protein
LLLLKFNLEAALAAQLWQIMDAQVRSGFWLAILCLVPGTALQLKLVKWERVAIGQTEGKILPPRPRSWRRSLRWVFAGGTTVLLAVSLWLFLPPDEPPPDLGDLVVTRLNLPDDQNACAIFLQAAGLVKTDLFKSTGDQLYDMAAGKTWDPALARQALDGADAVWPLWEQAARTPQGQVPLVKPLDFQPLIQLAQIRAWDLARNGKPDAAIESLFTTMQVGRRLEQSQGNLFYYFTAGGFRGGALNSLRLLATEYKPSADLLRQMIGQEEANRPDQAAFAIALRREFQSFSHELENPAEELSPKDQEEAVFRYFKIIRHVPEWFRPNQTLRIGAEATRMAISGIDLKPGLPAILFT